MNTDEDKDDDPLMGTDYIPLPAKTMRSLRTPKQRKIVVEPLVFFYSMATLPLDALRSQFLYHKVQEQMGIHLDNLTAQSGCDVNKSDLGYILREKVQSEASQWTMYISLAQILPSFFITLLFGIYSDHLGRRTAMILPPIGCLISILADMAVITFDLPIYFLFGEVIEYLFGGRYALISVVFAYVSDTCSNENKDLRMTIVDIIWLLTSAMADLLLGYLIRPQNYIAGFYVLALGQIFALIYAIFFIPEIVPVKKLTSEALSNKGEEYDKSKSESKSFLLTFDQIKSGAMLYIRDNGSGRRWKLNLLLWSYIFDFLIHGHQIVNLFVMNSPLCWKSVLIGYYGAVDNVVRCVGGLIIILSLRKCLGSGVIATGARVQIVVQYTYMAFVSTTVMMFFAPLTGCMSFLAIPLTRSLMSDLVEPYEQGAMFAVMSGVANITNLLSSVAVNKIYQGTLFLLPGFIFLCKAAVAFVSLLLLGIYVWKSKRVKVETSASIQASEEHH